MSQYTKWRDKCDRIFRGIVCEVYDGTACFACGRPLQVGKYLTDHPLFPEVCHWQNRGKIATRWTFANVALGHRQCNTDANDDKLEQFLVGKFGRKAIEDVREESSKLANLKWFELKEICEELKGLEAV